MEQGAQAMTGRVINIAVQLVKRGKKEFMEREVMREFSYSFPDGAIEVFAVTQMSNCALFTLTHIRSGFCLPDASWDAVPTVRAARDILDAVLNRVGVEKAQGIIAAQETINDIAENDLL